MSVLQVDYRVIGRYHTLEIGISRSASSLREVWTILMRGHPPTRHGTDRNPRWSLCVHPCERWLKRFGAAELDLRGVPSSGSKATATLCSASHAHGAATVCWSATPIRATRPQEAQRKTQHKVRRAPTHLCARRGRVCCFMTCSWRGCRAPYSVPFSAAPRRRNGQRPANTRCPEPHPHSGAQRTE